MKMPTKRDVKTPATQKLAVSIEFVCFKETMYLIIGSSTICKLYNYNVINYGISY
jgi:hypothetical protein